MRASDEILVRDLTDAGLYDLAERAGESEWNDYFGISDLPQVDLIEAITHYKDALPVLRQLFIERITNGRYDGTLEEAQEWANSAEGRDVFNDLRHLR